MGNYIKKYKKEINNKSIDYKMQFVKNLIEKKDYVLKDMYEFLDYVFYQNIQKSDREITMEEIYYYYELAEQTAINNNLEFGNEEEVEEILKWLEQQKSN